MGTARASSDVRDSWSEEEAEAFLAGMPDLDDLDYSMIVKTYDSPKSLSFRMAFVKNP